MALNAERLARAIKTLIESDLEDKLEAVETLWTDTSPITLAEPANVFLGHKPTLLEMPSSAFPIICVITPQRDPQQEHSRWGYQEQTVMVYLDFFTVASDEATVNLATWRYAEALVALLQDNRVIAGCAQLDFEPGILFSEASRHATYVQGDMQDDASVDFIQGGRIMLAFEDS